MQLSLPVQGKLAWLINYIWLQKTSSHSQLEHRMSDDKTDPKETELAQAKGYFEKGLISKEVYEATQLAVMNVTAGIAIHLLFLLLLSIHFLIFF